MRSDPTHLRRSIDPRRRLQQFAPSAALVGHSEINPKPISHPSTHGALSLYGRCDKMPATTVEEWLRSAKPDELHRCKIIVKEWKDEDGLHVTCRADDGVLQTHRLANMSSLSRRACFKCEFCRFAPRVLGHLHTKNETG